MANESNLNSQNDKLTKLLDIDWIKRQNISNLGDFSDYSEEDLKKMKEDVALSDDMEDGEKYRVRRNIDSILESKVKEQNDKKAQAAEEERQKQQEIIDQEKADARREQDDELNKKMAELNQWDSTDEAQDPQAVEINDETKNNQWSTGTQENQVSAEKGNTEIGEPWEPIVDSQETQGTTENNKTENYQEQIDELSRANEKLRQKVDEQSKQIEWLLAAQKEGNTEEVNRIKEELKKKNEELRKLREDRDKLLKDNKKMKDRFFGELPKYNGNIIPLKTKAVEFRFGVNAIEWNQRVLSMPQLRLRKNIISRHRLNTTIKKLNEIGDDPKRWVNYILTKSDFLKWWAKIWTLCKKIWNYFKIRDVDSFDQKFNEQKKIFIDDLEAKMQWRMSEDDKKTIKAIKDRLDYYQKAYKRKFLTV